MPLTQANGITIRYEIEGEQDAVPLLMVTGTGYPGAMYRTGPSALLAEKGFRVITYDHRGIGGSDKPDEPYSTRLFAQDASGLLQALGIERAHVLGHSMGGRVAQWMALDDPGRVRSLVLVASGAGQSGAEFAVTKGLALNEAMKLIERGYEGHIRVQMYGRFYFTPAFVERHPDVPEGLFRAFWDERPPLKCYLRHIIARQQHQTAERLAEIGCPTLVIVSDGDTEVGSTGSHFEQSEFLAQHIANTEWYVIPGAAHMFLWQLPEASTAAIADFLRRH